MELELSMEQKSGGQLLIGAWNDFSAKVEGALPWQNAAGRHFVTESAKSTLIGSLPSLAKENRGKLGLLATAGLGLAGGYLALDQIIRGPIYSSFNKTDSPASTDFRLVEPTEVELPTRKPGWTPAVGLTATVPAAAQVESSGIPWARDQHPGDEWEQPVKVDVEINGKTVTVSTIDLNLGDKPKLEALAKAELDRQTGGVFVYSAENGQSFPAIGAEFYSGSVAAARLITPEQLQGPTKEAATRVKSGSQV